MPASVVSEVSDRVRNLLPIAEPHVIEILDVNNVVMRTRWLRWSDETLALSVLGFRDEAPDPAEEKVVKTVTKLFGYG